MDIIKARSFFPLSVAFAVLIFGALFVLDFPKPELDDLFFVGAGLNLAQGGDFSNPLIERQQFPSHFYFVHPPTYSYVLAGWLNIFGISRFSLLGFQFLMYLLICAATIGLLRRHKAPAIWEWLVPLAVAAAFLPEGLRPESFSVALTMCGFALIQYGGTLTFSIFSGFLLMILGASVAERLTVFSAALTVAAVVDLRQRGVPLFRSILFTGSAVVITCAILAYLIRFRFGEFWNTFHVTAAGRLGGSKIASLVGFFRSFSLIQWPTILLWFACLPMLPLLGDKQIARTNLFLIGAFLVSAFIGASGHGAIWYVMLIVLITGIAGGKQFARKWSVTLPLLVTGVLLIANSRNCIYVAGIVGGRIKSDKGDRLAEGQALRATREHAVLIDSETARYVFDYHIPNDFLDWSFSSRFPGTLPTDDPLRPDDIYLIGPNSVDWLNLKTYLNRAVPKWKPLGPNKTFHEFPRWAYIIRPQECGEVKSRDSRELQR